MDATETRERPRSLDDILRERKETPAGPPDGEPPASADLPEEDDLDSYHPDGDEYRACGRVSSKTVPTLRFILKDQSEQHVEYLHLDSRRPGGCEFIPSLPGKGNVIRLRIAGSSATFIVEIIGRNLRLVWVRIVGHLTPWVHEYPGEIDSLGEGEPVITRITFTEVK